MIKLKEVYKIIKEIENKNFNIEELDYFLKQVISDKEFDLLVDFRNQEKSLKVVSEFIWDIIH